MDVSSTYGVRHQLEHRVALNKKEEEDMSEQQSSTYMLSNADAKQTIISETIASSDYILSRHSSEPKDGLSLAASLRPTLLKRASRLNYYHSLLRGRTLHMPQDTLDDCSGGYINVRQQIDHNHLRVEGATGASCQQSDVSKDSEFWKSYQVIWNPTNPLWTVYDIALSRVRQESTDPRIPELPSSEQEFQSQEGLDQQRLYKGKVSTLHNIISGRDLPPRRSFFINNPAGLPSNPITGSKINCYIERYNTPTNIHPGKRQMRNFFACSSTLIRPAKSQKRSYHARGFTLRGIKPSITRTAKTYTRRRGRYFLALRAFELRRRISASMHPEHVVGPRMNAFVRLGPKDLSNESFSSHWNINFSRIKMEAEFGFSAFREKRNSRNIDVRTLPFWDIPCKAITQKWLSLPSFEREHMWRSIMIPLLIRDSAVALKFLVATCFPPYPPGYAITDSLEFIVSRFLAKEDKRRPKNVESILAILIRFLDHVERDYFHLNDRTIRNLLPFLNGEQLSRLFDKLVQCNHPLHPHTAAHFITAFAETKQTRMAIDCMRWLRGKTWVDFSSPIFEAVCSTLLQHKNRTSSADAPSDAEIFSLMLDCGLRPNIITYNILLRNAIESGDSDTALQIHRMMTENGHIPNRYTYAILLNDAKRRLARDEIYNIFDIAARSEELDSYCVTEFIHAIFLMAEADRKAAQVEPRLKWDDSLNLRAEELPFNRMLSMYSRFFDTGPLWELVPNYRSLQAADKTKWQPSKSLLIIMLIGILRELNSNVAIQSIYDRLRELIAKQHYCFKAFAHSTHAYDAIIMAFGRSDETLSRCTSVIRHMIVSHTHSRRHVAPSARTWSILLKAFMDHGQPRAAEKVLNMMQERGIEPNIVTWNSLSAGYARLQDTQNALKAVERMQSEGWELDERGLSGLQNLQDHKALLSALRTHSGSMTLKQKDADSNSANQVQGLMRRSRFVPLSVAAPLKIATPLKAMVEEHNMTDASNAVEIQTKSTIDNMLIRMDDLVFPLATTPPSS